MAKQKEVSVDFWVIINEPGMGDLSFDKNLKKLHAKPISPFYSWRYRDGMLQWAYDDVPPFQLNEASFVKMIISGMIETGIVEAHVVI